MKTTLLLTTYLASSARAFYENEDPALKKFLAQARQVVIDDDEIYENQQRPIIGIVTHPILDRFVGEAEFEGFNSYIEESYVKLIEASGARAVPILYNPDGDETMTEDYEWIIKRINGLILPSSSDIEAHETWEKEVIEDILYRMDSYDKYIPIMGVGLGFQRLVNYFYGDDS
jgi:gamma-glutamyl hydrolase